MCESFTIEASLKKSHEVSIETFQGKDGVQVMWNSLTYLLEKLHRGRHRHMTR